MPATFRHSKPQPQQSEHHQQYFSGFDIIALGGGVSLSNAVMSNVNIYNYGVGTNNQNGLWAKSSVAGSMRSSAIAR
ncbi:MAG: hypothetical protein WDM76_09445 [Limisphaerales bacterium]